MGNGTGKSTAKKRAASKDLVPRERANPIYHYQMFLQALARHESDPGFPNFFATSKFAATLGQFVTDSLALAQATLKRKKLDSVAAAARARGDTVLGSGEAALVAAYGPSDAVLGDFGIRPKGPHRRHPRAAGKAGTAGGAHGGTPKGMAPGAAAGAASGAAVAGTTPGASPSAGTTAAVAPVAAGSAAGSGSGAGAAGVKA